MDNINPSATTNYLTPLRSGDAASRRSSGTGSSSVAVPATSIDARDVPIMRWRYEIPAKSRSGFRGEHPLLSGFNV